MVREEGGNGHARLAPRLEYGGAGVELKVHELYGRRLLEQCILLRVRRDQLGFGVLGRDVPTYRARLKQDKAVVVLAQL